MKKIIRFLIFGLSLFVILAAFKVSETNKVSADYACPAPVGSVSNLTPNGTSFPAGTRSATLTWSAASQATNYAITVRTQSGQTLFADDNYPSTTVAISNLLTDGTSYIWLLRPKNNCESGNLFQATFSVAAAPTSGNQTQSPTCSISASDSTPSNGEFVNLTASAQAYGGKNIREYRWDLDGNGSYDASGSQTGRNYFQDTTVRLEVEDSQGYTGQCTRFLNVSGTSGSTGTTCRSLTCPSAPAGCSYSRQLTYSCDPNAILTCGVLTGNCSTAGSSTYLYPGNAGNGTTIVNNNSSSSSSSSSNSNNNNITIK